jgi:tetratricopeptide (TPR) repeat protein
LRVCRITEEVAMFLPRSIAQACIRIAAVLGLFVFLPGAASAQNRYAVLHIDNNTKDVTIYYKVRWGTEAWGQEVKIAPGERWDHWYPYAKENQNSSPVPQITFDTGINKAGTSKLYDLTAFASPNKVGGKVYAFEKRTDAQGEKHIELFSKDNKQAAPKIESTLPPAVGNAYTQGLKNLADNQFEQAIDQFTKAIKAAPTFADAYVQRGRAYKAMKEYGKSIDDFTAAIKIDDKHAVAYNMRGLVYDDIRELDKAYNDFTKAVLLQKDFAVAYHNRGYILVQKGKYDEAVVEFNTALQFNLSTAVQPLTHNQLGLISFFKGQFDAAIAAYTKAISFNGKFAMAYSNRGAAYYKKGDYNAAIKDCDEAIRLNAELPSPYRWRSQAYARLGKVDWAKKDYFRAIRLDPNQHDRFEFTSFLVDRQQALVALQKFQLGSTLTPKLLQNLNDLPGGEPLEDTKGEMSGSAKELIASEKTRYEALQFEMVAAADILLTAAKMTPAQRQAKGLKLSWLFGPVTAPNARPESKDGLAGLRVIGRLDLPNGKQINSIFALKFHPVKDPSSDEEGKVGLLSDADTFRLEVRLFNKGSTISPGQGSVLGRRRQGGPLV